MYFKTPITFFSLEHLICLDLINLFENKQIINFYVQLTIIFNLIFSWLITKENLTHYYTEMILLLKTKEIVVIFNVMSIIIRNLNI